MLDVTQYEEGESANDPSILEEDKLTADVIGTIPVGEFRISQGNGEYDEAYWGMGLTGYNLADGYETPVAIEDKASLSQNLDGAFSLRGHFGGAAARRETHRNEHLRRVYRRTGLYPHDV